MRPRLINSVSSHYFSVNSNTILFTIVYNLYCTSIITFRKITGICLPLRTGLVFNISVSTILKRLNAYLKNNKPSTGIQYWFDVSFEPCLNKSAASQMSAYNFFILLLSIDNPILRLYCINI